jgi:hypothetical protein
MKNFRFDNGELKFQYKRSEAWVLKKFTTVQADAGSSPA